MTDADNEETMETTTPRQADLTECNAQLHANLAFGHLQRRLWASVLPPAIDDGEDGDYYLLEGVAERRLFGPKTNGAWGSGWTLAPAKDAPEPSSRQPGRGKGRAGDAVAEQGPAQDGEQPPAPPETTA